MPRTPEANERIRRATRERIIAAAMDTFMDKGYHAASIDDVARAAKVSKGLLYHYVEGKEDLLAALVDRRIDELLAVMRAAAAHEDPAAGLRHIVEGALDNVRRRPEVFRFYLNLSTQPRLDPVVTAHAGRLNAAYAEQFEVQTRLFEQLGIDNARERSLYFSSTLQGIMLLYSTYPEGYPLDAIKAHVIAEFRGEAPSSG